VIHVEAGEISEVIVEWKLRERKIIHRSEKVHNVLTDLVEKQSILEP